MRNPPPPKSGQELLLETDVDNAQYQLSERFGSVTTPKYYNHRRKNQAQSD